jgi:carbohydrate-selective porin OprB
VRAASVAILALAASVHAQDTEENVEELLDEEEASEHIDSWIDDPRLRSITQPYVDFKHWLSTGAGLDVGTQNVLIYQRATGGRRPREGAINNFTLFGDWHPFAERGREGELGFSFERRDTLSDATVTQFSAAVGTSFQTNDLAISTRDRTALRQLWWKQPFADGRLVLRIGKIAASAHYDRNRVTGGASTGFMSQPFATNPTRAFPGDGLGFNLTFAVNDHLELTGGLQDANGNNERSGFNTIGDGELFAAFGVRLTPVIDGLGPGNYRLLLWHTDESSRTDDGYGFLASLDQDLDERTAAFLRYGYSERQVGRLEHLVSGGLAFRDPLSLQRGDLAGVGLGWTKGNRDDDGELSTELFYRIQLTKFLQLTPSVLVVFDPQGSDKTDPVAVFGIRMRVLF